MRRLHTFAFPWLEIFADRGFLLVMDLSDSDSVLCAGPSFP
jgi:hypothetical protein